MNSFSERVPGCVTESDGVSSFNANCEQPTGQSELVSPRTAWHRRSGRRPFSCPPLLWPVKRQKGILGPLTLCLLTGNETTDCGGMSSRLTSLSSPLSLREVFIITINSSSLVLGATQNFFFFSFGEDLLYIKIETGNWMCLNDDWTVVNVLEYVHVQSVTWITYSLRKLRKDI